MMLAFIKDNSKLSTLLFILSIIRIDGIPQKCGISFDYYFILKYISNNPTEMCFFHCLIFLL